jgi:hypothetical protein
LWTVDGDQIVASAMYGATPAYVDFLRNGPHWPGPSSALARFRRGESYIHGEILESEGYRTSEPLALALVELGGGRVQLGVPLQKDGVLIGIFISTGPNQRCSPTSRSRCYGISRRRQ